MTTSAGPNAPVATNSKMKIETQSCSTHGTEAIATAPPEITRSQTGRSAAPCLVCGTCFIPRRKDQRYCHKTCAKVATRNNSRNPRRVSESAEAARTYESRKGRVRGLSHALYETPPAYRASFLQRLIAEGRYNAELRRLITIRCLVRSWFGIEGTGRLHIAHVLDHFCQEVYGMRSFEVLDRDTSLPPLHALAFPTEYFGPDAPPVYSDGALKERPCPWTHRRKSLHHYKGADGEDHIETEG